MLSRSILYTNLVLPLPDMENSKLYVSINYQKTSTLFGAITFASKQRALLDRAGNNRGSGDFGIVGTHMFETATGICSAYVDGKF